jgi:hypothetical protein
MPFPWVSPTAGFRTFEKNASGGQGLFLKKPPLDPAKTFYFWCQANFSKSLLGLEMQFVA